MDRDNVGLLPAFAFGTLFLFYIVWAAMHDIAHGDEGAIETIALAISVVAFALLYRHALRLLAFREEVAWLIGTGILLALFNAGAVSSMFHPKYPKDPMLATAFLCAGVPGFGLIVYRLVHDATHRRTKSRT